VLITIAQGSEIWQPRPGTTWQWQLTGTIDTSYDVDMYDIDLFDVGTNVIDLLHSQGKVVICYFSAGTFEDWRPDASLFPSTVIGNKNGWPGEKWLDISKIDVLSPIMTTRMDLATTKRCDGVEPDNVDGYDNKSGFNISYNDQIKYNSWLAQEAHLRNLSIGLKNDGGQADDLVAHFDWSLNEECFKYKECKDLKVFIKAKKAVFQTEYKLETTQFCSEANQMGFSAMKKNKKLDAWVEPCWNLTSYSY